MSADNWTTCPRCAIQARRKLELLDVEVRESYGAVPVEEFDRLRAERDRIGAAPLDQTLREDYEFWGVSEGEFNARYSAYCTVCGFTYEFEHNEPLTVEEDRP